MKDDSRDIGRQLRPGEPPREGAYRSDQAREAAFFAMNQALAGLEAESAPPRPEHEPPYIFICYAPRSGSTLVSQVLAASGLFEYVSNLMARFWMAPYLGALLDDELGVKDDARGREFGKSDLGRTKGPGGPHEFGFFWNRWRDGLAAWDQTGQCPAELEPLAAQLRSLGTLSERPWVFKNGTPGRYPHLMRRLLRRPYFIILRREPIFIAQSIYKARQDIYGDPNVWWSRKPVNYDEIVAQYPDPYNQVALQVKAAYEEIDRSTAEFRHLCYELAYDDFCADPRRHAEAIARFVGAEPPPGWEKNVPERFKPSARALIAEADFRLLQEALERHDVRP